MLWVRGALSRLEQLSVRSFVAQGHPVHLYTYDPALVAPPGVTVLDASQIVPADLVPAVVPPPFSRGGLSTFSNYFRYRLLFERGGWWADTDVVAIRPWADLPPVVVASTRERGHGLAANNFAMRFPAGHEIPRACLDALRDQDPRELDFGVSGPLLVDRVLGPEGIARHCQPPEVFGPVPWNASWQLVRPLWRRFGWSEVNQRLRYRHLSCRFTRATVGIHLWHETWRTNGRDKHARFAASCLYERLQRRYNS